MFFVGAPLAAPANLRRLRFFTRDEQTRPLRITIFCSFVHKILTHAFVVKKYIKHLEKNKNILYNKYKENKVYGKNRNHTAVA